MKMVVLIKNEKMKYKPQCLNFEVLTLNSLKPKFAFLANEQPIRISNTFNTAVLILSPKEYNQEPGYGFLL